jgi:hypothetical protein
MSLHIIRIIVLAGFALLVLVSCAMRPVPALQDVPIANPNAPLAFFGESTANSQMRYEYAVALQKAGFYNFTAENFSEEQVENPIEIRLNYSEEQGNFNGIPVLVLKTEILKNKAVWFRFTIKETSDKNDLNNLRNKRLEKNFRKHVLLERFLEEVKRVSS